MWLKEYRDYPLDSPLKKHQVESGRGIIGCEMHEINGWGLTFQDYRQIEGAKCRKEEVIRGR